jgi:dTDP-4-dehydrorhamnose reductase
MRALASSTPLELWGGVECTVNRIEDEFRDQVVLTGHDVREDDLDRFAALGLRTLRFPVLWERTAPVGLGQADWRWADSRLARARALGLRPIVTLLHHGSGPAQTNLLDPLFPERLAAYAQAVAERYPWVTAYTPVNEPITTARFSALYGLWYPHVRSDLEFLRAVLTECRATVLAMKAIREVVPEAELVQTEDLGRTSGTSLLAYQVNFDNDRRWLGLDLLTGRLRSRDRMWRHMRALGIDDSSLAWFRKHACPPDIVGVNHYPTSNRYLDTDLGRYPPDTWGGNGRHRYADVAAVRVLEDPGGPAELLEEAWERYRLPLAITEAHLGCTREEQLRWLRDMWEAAHRARSRGAVVRAVTAWALLGTFDWDSLLTRAAGHYEPGAFDVRGPTPRLTAVGRMIGELAGGRQPSAQVAEAPGWWRRPIRFAHGHASREPDGPGASKVLRAVPPTERPILITGAGGTLATAMEHVAVVRGLGVRALGRAELDIADTVSVAAALDERRPWAVVNAAGYVRVDDAEHDRDRCFRENVDGPVQLARACRQRDVALVTFSSDLVFSGTGCRPYVESDRPAPTTVYGASKAEAESRVGEILPEALIVRTAAFFGPWDRSNIPTRALAALRAGQDWTVPGGILSPTYVPDLANAALDLLIDGERGVWHLTNGGAVSWLEFVRRVASLMGVDTTKLREDQEQVARPYRALGSHRGMLLPLLDDALARYIADAAIQLARTQPTDSSTPRIAAGA